MGREPLHNLAFEGFTCRRKHTVLTTAAIHLESLLISVDVELDTRPRAGQRSNGTRFTPVERAILITVDSVAVVVTGAVVTAVAEELRRCEVGADLLGSRPEVVDGVLLVGQNSAIRNENVVNTDTLAGIRHIQGVVQSSKCGRVNKGVQVPVRVRSQNYWFLLGYRKSGNLDVPSVRRHGVSDVADDFTRETFLAIGIND